ncbi:MAG: hypothetical protein Q9224_006203 [Gallowayella concinna]
MGGFSMDCAFSEKSFLPSGLTRATLTPDGIRFLLEHEPGALPSITREQIQDKSKADGIKKTLVCAQASWFCLQCITRLAQSLPVSLLELNTFGHALCTLVIYIFWWSKPLDIEEPTLIQDEKLYSLFAYMWMSSRISAEGYYTKAKPDTLQDEFHCIWPSTEPVIQDLVLGGDCHTKRYDSLALKYGMENAKHQSSVDSKRWKLALEAISNYELEGDLRSRHRRATSGRFVSTSLNIRIPFLDAVRGNLLDPRLELRVPNAVPTLVPGGIVPGFAIAGTLYGGLHLVAWFAPLSSPLESLLWRIASLSVTCTGLVFGLLALLIKTDTCKRNLSNIAKLLNRKPLDCSSKTQRVKAYFAAVITGLLSCIILPCLPVLWFLYLASRGYLVVESLKNIAYLPPASFETAIWPSYFPHIT